jgi:hypothetical protein
MNDQIGGRLAAKVGRECHSIEVMETFWPRFDPSHRDRRIRSREMTDLNLGVVREKSDEAGDSLTLKSQTLRESETYGEG